MKTFLGLLILASTLTAASVRADDLQLNPAWLTIDGLLDTQWKPGRATFAPTINQTARENREAVRNSLERAARLALASARDPQNKNCQGEYASPELIASLKAMTQDPTRIFAGIAELYTLIQATGDDPKTPPVELARLDVVARTPYFGDGRTNAVLKFTATTYAFGQVGALYEIENIHGICREDD